MKLYIVEGAAPCGKTIWLRRFVVEHQEEGAAYFTGEQICDIAVALASSVMTKPGLRSVWQRSSAEKSIFQ